MDWRVVILCLVCLAVVIAVWYLGGRRTSRVALCIIGLIAAGSVGFFVSPNSTEGSAILTLDNLDVIPSVQPGKTVTWIGLPPPSVSFFAGYDPCDKWTSNPLTCTIKPGLADGFYNYQITAQAVDPLRVLHIVSCPHCPGNGSKVKGGPNPPPPSSSDNPPLVGLLCLNNKPASLPPTVNTTAGTSVKWFSEGDTDKDWSVTFPTGKNPCGANSTFNAGNPTCTIASGSASPYTYTITLPKSACSAVTGTGIINVSTGP